MVLHFSETQKYKYKFGRKVFLFNFSEVEYCALPHLRFSLRFRLKFRFSFRFRFRFRFKFFISLQLKIEIPTKATDQFKVHDKVKVIFRFRSTFRSG